MDGDDGDEVEAIQLAAATLIRGKKVEIYALCAKSWGVDWGVRRRDAFGGYRGDEVLRKELNASVLKRARAFLSNCQQAALMQARSPSVVDTASVAEHAPESNQTCFKRTLATRVDGEADHVATTAPLVTTRELASSIEEAEPPHKISRNADEAEASEDFSGCGFSTFQHRSTHKTSNPPAAVSEQSSGPSLGAAEHEATGRQQQAGNTGSQAVAADLLAAVHDIQLDDSRASFSGLGVAEPASEFALLFPKPDVRTRRALRWLQQCRGQLHVDTIVARLAEWNEVLRTRSPRERRRELWCRHSITMTRKEERGELDTQLAVVREHFLSICFTARIKTLEAKSNQDHVG
jgi:hypothetical protein